MRFVADVKSAIPHAHHGIGLYDADRKLLWGTALKQFHLDAGVQQFVYNLPDLPVKPGAYCWRVTLWDDEELVDGWECVPDLLVATKPVTHWLDEWAGILNIPSRFTVAPLEQEAIDNIEAKQENAR